MFGSDLPPTAAEKLQLGHFPTLLRLVLLRKQCQCIRLAIAWHKTGNTMQWAKDTTEAENKPFGGGSWQSWQLINEASSLRRLVMSLDSAAAAGCFRANIDASSLAIERRTHRSLGSSCAWSPPAPHHNLCNW
jgi:hypothetical protein